MTDPRKLPDDITADLDAFLQRLIKSSVLSAVTRRLAKQTEKGVEKYGSPVQSSDLSPIQWVDHAADEFVDALVYLECMKQQMQDAKEHLNGIPHDLEGAWKEIEALVDGTEPPLTEREKAIFGRGHMAGFSYAKSGGKI
jgi:hypothetical protein